MQHMIPKGEIDNADIMYIDALSKITANIIYISDNEVLPGETNKIKDKCIYIETKHHGEYDFGSYKRGFFYAQKNGLLNNIDELIFANDSCYAPFYSLENVFKTMSEKNCDFWGITQNNEIEKHIQYFLLPVANQES